MLKYTESNLAKKEDLVQAHLANLRAKKAASKRKVLSSAADPQPSEPAAKRQQIDEQKDGGAAGKQQKPTEAAGSGKVCTVSTVQYGCTYYLL